MTPVNAKFKKDGEDEDRQQVKDQRGDCQQPGLRPIFSTTDMNIEFRSCVTRYLWLDQGK